VNLRIRDATVGEIPYLEALQMRASLVPPDYREQFAGASRGHPTAAQ
jgi:hypothetical protein